MPQTLGTLAKYFNKMVEYSGCYKQTSRTTNRTNIPLETMKHANRLDPKERIFLDATEKGDKHTMIRLLQGPNPVNVNCTNMLGRSAIQIAVDNENTEIVELLLKEDGVKIGDALLYAIREGVFRIVEMIIAHPTIQRDRLGTEWCKTRHMDDESFDYSPDISPLMLAAHCNQFEILQLLLLQGASIDRPHQLSCSCKRCQVQVHADSLRHSLFRINTYRALASPAWISLTCPDPVLAAFKLSWELDKLALRENEFKDSYLELGHQVKKYACDLLGQCRTSEEVVAVLNKTNESDTEDEDDNNEKLTLSRLKLAIKYEQKQFVAHPHCQQLLTSIWYEGLPGWRKRNGFTKFLICTGLIFLLPFMSVYYWIFPRSKIGQLLRSPFMKFLYHSASFGVFLILLVSASTDIGTAPSREMLRGPAPSELEWLIVLWVTGFIWAECKQLWEEGLQAYVRQWWNWLDFIMLSLYLATFSLRFVAYLQIESAAYGPGEIHRKDWPTNDPTLISEGLFAIANIFSFARIIFLFQANQHLGPLQISLGCMLIDIVKFLFIFFLVLTSFACGLNQLYYFYKPSSMEENQDVFFTLGGSYLTLFWSMFSLTPPKDIEITNGHSFTMMIGEFMFMAYHGMAIIVLLNMLIAMMSSSFQDIENHCDMEWKFSRSKLWIGYFDEGSTLPPPFNLFISPKSIFYFYDGIKRVICSCLCGGNDCERVRKTSDHSIRARRTVEPRENYIFKTQSSGEIGILNENPFRPTYNGDIQNRPSYSVATKDALLYQDIMRRLVSRLIHQYKKQARQDGVNEDDLLEIKQDISSLRYELREDRKRETVLLNRNPDSLWNKEMSYNLQQFVSPEASPRIPHSRSSPNTRSNKHSGSFSKYELDYLKHEIVKSMKAELRETVNSCFTSFTNQQAMNNMGPIDSELYQTHLYTSL